MDRTYNKTRLKGKQQTASRSEDKSPRATRSVGYEDLHAKKHREPMGHLKHGLENPNS